MSKIASIPEHVTMAVLKDATDQSSDHITVRVPTDMVTNWVSRFPKFSDRSRALTRELMKIMLDRGISIDNLEGFNVVCKEMDYDKKIYGIWMEAVMDIRNFLGDEDFFELYATGEDFEEVYGNNRVLELMQDAEVTVFSEKSD